MKKEFSKFIVDNLRRMKDYLKIGDTETHDFIQAYLLGANDMAYEINLISFEKWSMIDKVIQTN